MPEPDFYRRESARPRPDQGARLPPCWLRVGRQAGQHHPRRLTWPTLVLAGGVALSLASNLSQAKTDTWGRIMAAVPPAAFLAAVSMIESRAVRHAHPAADVPRHCDDIHDPSAP